MTKDEAQAKIKELDAAIKAAEKHQEKLATEHNIVLYRGGYGSGRTFYPTREAAIDECDGDTWTASYVERNLGGFPSWVSSSEMC